MLQAILFDLDSTLYDPTQYYLGAFRDIGRLLAKRYARDEARLAEELEALWRQRTSRDPQLFDSFLDEQGLPGQEVATLVECFHSHRPELALYPDAQRLLDALHGRLPMGLITNGHAGMQRAKVEALELEQWLRPIVCTGEHPPEWRKPGHAAFASVCSAWGLRPDEVVYLGDDPRVDPGGPRAIGMPVVRLRRGEYRDEAADRDTFDDEIDDFGELLEEFEGMAKR